MRGGMFSIAVVATVALMGCGKDSPTSVDGGGIDAGPDAPSSTAHLTIDRDSADLGMIAVGDMTPQTTFTIRNTGSDPTGQLMVTVAGAGYRKAHDTCSSGNLGPGSMCTVAIDATPSAPGAFTGTLTVSATPGGSVHANLTATGLAPGELMAMPSSHDFGTITAGTTTAPTTISIENTGQTPTGIVVVTLGGPDALEAELIDNGCVGAVLAAGASCDVMVRMRPPMASTGAKTAMLTATANPGGTAVATLTATVERPAILAINGAGAFGGQLLGTTATRTLTVVNNGAQPTGAVTITRTGNAAFQVLTGMANDCVSGTTTLMPAATCDVRVQYTATIPGAVVGTITAAATPGGSAMASLTGTGQRPARLTGDLVQSFGGVEVGTLSTNTVTWTITNAGDQPTSVPVLTNPSAELVVANNGCMAAIPALGTCAITFKFMPGAGGPRSANATVAISNGSMVTASITATGMFRVTLGRTGDAGRVTSNPAGLDCNAPAFSCSGLFAPGNVTLQARTTNGSFVYFGSWSGPAAGACAGSPARDCQLTVDGPKMIAATFLGLNFNLAFVSSTEQPTNLGGAAAYDAVCNQLATAAGINDAGGSAFIAWMSDATSTAVGRLGPAGGWVRMDGKVIALDRGSLVNTQRILNPVRWSETGADLGDTSVMTGSAADGTTAANQHCSGWTGSGTAALGNSMGGPTFWGSGQTGACGATYHVLCLMKSYVAGPAAADTTVGKKLWLTNGAYGPSVTGDPDALCNADRPAGVASGRALVARTTTTAASLLGMATMYVRVDGQEVGTGAELIAEQARGGVWQQGNGTYWSGQAWTGSQAIDQLGIQTSTCGDWTIAASSGRYTLPGLARRFWGSTLPVIVCNNIPASGPRLMCYEP